MSEIRLEGVSKSFGNQVTVIDGLDLTIREGEFMVLVGPSGCAKSTTLRMIAGLESITGGSLWIGGKRANALSPKERNISMVFQSYALFPNMTVRGNLSFGMEVRKESRKRTAAEVDRVAEMLGLSDLLDRKPKELSGGQAQRVALGRAMIRRPGAFLFDEPLSNLDAELRVHMRGEISQMQRDLGTTTVFVTHDQTEAMTMGDRVAVMNKGRIMQVGTPLELYDRPANKFVAGFIGSPKMNFLAVIAGACLGRTLPDQTLAQITANGAVLAVRPEHVTIVSSDAGDAELAFDATVRRIEALGHETLVSAVEPQSEEVLTLRAPAGAAAAIEPGATIRLAIAYRRMSFFAEQSGERIT